MTLHPDPTPDDSIADLLTRAVKVIDTELERYQSIIDRLTARRAAINVVIAWTDPVAPSAEPHVSSDGETHQPMKEPAPRKPRPRPTPTPEATAAKPGPKTDKPSLDEVAAIANQAIADGHPAVPALVAHYGKPTTTVKNWYSQARAAGLITRTADSPIRVIEDNTTRPATRMPALTEIAATVRDAYTAGRRPVQTVIDRYDCTREQATQWINLARTAGHLPPRDQPQVQAELPPSATPRIGGTR